jgi:hypothetical protein
MSTEQNIEADDDLVAARWAAATDEDRYGASTEEVVEIGERISNSSQRYLFHH